LWRTQHMSFQQQQQQKSVCCMYVLENLQVVFLAPADFLQLLMCERIVQLCSCTWFRRAYPVLIPMLCLLPSSCR
jgi:hypothetical protein